MFSKTLPKINILTKKPGEQNQRKPTKKPAIFQTLFRKQKKKRKMIWYKRPSEPSASPNLEPGSFQQPLEKKQRLTRRYKQSIEDTYFRDVVTPFYHEAHMITSFSEIFERAMADLRQDTSVVTDIIAVYDDSQRNPNKARDLSLLMEELCENTKIDEWEWKLRSLENLMDDMKKHVSEIKRLKQVNYLTQDII